VIRNVVVQAGDVLGNYNFGEIGNLALKAPLINGYVYLDREHSRQRPVDGSAPGLSGWTVQLTQGATTIAPPLPMPMVSTSSTICIARAMKHPVCQPVPASTSVSPRMAIKCRRCRLRATIAAIPRPRRAA